MGCPLEWTTEISYHMHIYWMHLLLLNTPSLHQTNNNHARIRAVRNRTLVVVTVGIVVQSIVLSEEF